MKPPKLNQNGVELDPREPNQVLWAWLLADSWQQPEVRAKFSKRAKQRDDEYWINHSRAVTENHRQVREAWLTDQEKLLTPGGLDS